MKAYIGIKYYEDGRNKPTIEQISDALEKVGYQTVCIARDIEKWGLERFTSRELMETTFQEIDSCDVVVIDLSEKGVGLGIEAGYAFAKGIPVVTIALEGSDISNTILGISTKVVTYTDLKDLDISFLQR